MSKEPKDLKYWKNNCEEDYIKTPISVLRYISELEKAITVTHCCKSDSEQLDCEKCNGTGGYSYTDKIGFNYKTCECQTN